MLKFTRRTLLATVAFATVATAGIAYAEDKVIIGFSQASSNSAHRNTMTKRNVVCAEES
jgi:ribose transport system substrate-binding protein